METTQKRVCVLLKVVNHVIWRYLISYPTPEITLHLSVICLLCYYYCLMLLSVIAHFVMNILFYMIYYGHIASSSPPFILHPYLILSLFRWFIFY